MQPEVMRRMPAGFSLLELLITIAIIGIVSAVAMPAYRSYVDAANISKVNAAYENAVRFARQEYNKNQTRVTLGLSSTLPDSDAAWLAALGTEVQAPGGGPIYVTKKTLTYDTSEINTRGAVLVNYNDKKGHLDIHRPSYLGLNGLRSRITADSVKMKEK